MAQPHVLVVDDSEAILAFTRAVLSATYAVSTARNGREGLDLCKRLVPDLVLLDLSMPEMDGEAVLAQLATIPELSSIPVVIVSSEQARAEACVARGAAGCLIKPVRAEELLALVGRTLQAAQQPRPGGPSYLAAFFELFGESVCVLDLAARFGIVHGKPVIDRMLVI